MTQYVLAFFSCWSRRAFSLFLLLTSWSFLLWLSTLCFQNLCSTTFSLPVLFSKFCSVLSSPIQEPFLKNYGSIKEHKEQLACAVHFTFSPLPQGKVCACRVTLYFRKALLAFLIYMVLYMLCSWMEGGSFSDSY